MSIYNPVPTTIQELRKLYTSEEILFFYFGVFEESVFYKSPFRDEGKGSFVIDYYNNKWVWRDFGISPKHKSGFDFVQMKFKLSYHSTIIKIHTDLSNNKDKLEKLVKKEPLNKVKQVSCKLWIPKNKVVLDYWFKHGLKELSELLHYGIYEGIILHNNKIVLQSGKHRPQMIYLFEKSTKSWKGYHPKAREEELKFFNNNVSHIIQNWKELDNTHNIWGQRYDEEIMFISASYKDAIVINKAGYHSVAPQSENSFLDIWDLDYLKSRFKYIYVFYDNDATGVKKCIEYTQANDLYYINIPTGLSTVNKPCKDPADVIYIYDYKMLDSIINDKLERDGIN